MIDFLNLFADVFLFPLDPVNLNFDDNVVMISLSAVLLGMGIVRLFREVLWRI